MRWACAAAAIAVLGIAPRPGHGGAQASSAAGSDAADGQMAASAQMDASMQMDDSTSIAKLSIDQLEWRGAGVGAAGLAWDAQAWYGGDVDRLWLKSEGQWQATGRDAGEHDASMEALWNRFVSSWWALQVGARADVGGGTPRGWVAAGLQGILPQWIDTEATLYAGDGGRTAARLKMQYDLPLTQRLFLQPFLEANLYGRSDPQRQVGSGLSDLEVSLRLRYEIRREVAPYVGLVWLRDFGPTATLVRAAGGEPRDLELAAGLRVWL